MKTNRVLVTGATGYIGSNLVKRLVSLGWDVHVVARARSELSVLQPIQHAITLHHHDGTTEGLSEAVRQAQPELVFHLASLFLAQHKPSDVVALISSNILFAAQLAEAMLINGVTRLINTGTSWQHYQDSSFDPVNLYAATKQAFEDILQYYVNAQGFRVISLIIFDTYGPLNARGKLISLLWKCAQSQQPLAMSPGEQEIDLVHIEDVLDAFVRAAELSASQEPGHLRYGVSSGKPMRLRHIVAAFESATGYRLPISWGGRAYRPREVMLAWSNFQALPGWSPRISFQSAIAQTRPPAVAQA